MAAEKIGTTKLWLGALDVSSADRSVEDIQRTVTEYVTESRRVVTAAYLSERAVLLLLHWPETRHGYDEQSVEMCEQSRQELADILNAKTTNGFQLQEGEISCMMGLKVGGYNDGRIADLSEIAAYKTDLHMEPAHMVSARTKHDGSTESYGEPTVYLTGSTAAERAIHAIGDQLEQHHYGIQHGTGTTDFYETKWAIS